MNLFCFSFLAKKKVTLNFFSNFALLHMFPLVLSLHVPWMVYGTEQSPQNATHPRGSESFFCDESSFERVSQDYEKYISSPLASLPKQEKVTELPDSIKIDFMKMELVAVRGNTDYGMEPTMIINCLTYLSSKMSQALIHINSSSADYEITWQTVSERSVHLYLELQKIEEGRSNHSKQTVAKLLETLDQFTYFSQSDARLKNQDKILSSMSEKSFGKTKIVVGALATIATLAALKSKGSLLNLLKKLPFRASQWIARYGRYGAYLASGGTLVAQDATNAVSDIQKQDFAAPTHFDEKNAGNITHQIKKYPIDFVQETLARLKVSVPDHSSEFTDPIEYQNLLSTDFLSKGVAGLGGIAVGVGLSNALTRAAERINWESVRNWTPSSSPQGSIRQYSIRGNMIWFKRLSQKTKNRLIWGVQFALGLVTMKYAGEPISDYSNSLFYDFSEAKFLKLFSSNINKYKETSSGLSKYLLMNRLLSFVMQYGKFVRLPGIAERDILKTKLNRLTQRDIFCAVEVDERSLSEFYNGKTKELTEASRKFLSNHISDPDLIENLSTSLVNSTYTMSDLRFPLHQLRSLIQDPLLANPSHFLRLIEEYDTELVNYGELKYHKQEALQEASFLATTELDMVAQNEFIHWPTSWSQFYNWNQDGPSPSGHMKAICERIKVKNP